MIRVKSLPLFLVLALFPGSLLSQISFPDIPGYLSLTCDFHMHTVFSDGSVWPGIRVQEALSEGLDVISITDHLEYQPHGKDLPHPDRNRPNVLAREAAKGSELLVVAGAEITRSMPPGHFNALFVKDVNKLLLDDPMEVFKEAARQEAFVMWNHPHWTAQAAKGIVPVSPIHEELFDKGLVQGIEVYNEFTYSDEALELAIVHGLAPLGSSDVHGLVHHTFGLDEGGHRPITIVFAEEKNEESLKEALLEGRTVVWFDQTLVGQDAYLAALVETCIEVQKVGGALVQEVKLTNRSSSDFILRNTSDLNFHNKAAVFRVPARESLSLYVKTMEELQSFPLSFQVLNAFSAPDRHPKIQFIVK